MSDKKCNIVKDLLPLYADEVVSSDTKEFVENHLNECEGCRNELEMMRKDMTSMNIIEKNKTLTEPMVKIKKQILKKQIMIALVSVLVVACIMLCGLKLYMIQSRPDVNGNEKYISTALAEDGTPKDVLYNTGNGFEVSKEMGEIYISLPVNNKKMLDSKIVAIFNGQEIDNKTVPVSKAGYVTYTFEDLQNREEGLYLFAFYGADDEINQYVSVMITP